MRNGRLQPSDQDISKLLTLRMHCWKNMPISRYFLLSAHEQRSDLVVLVKNRTIKLKKTPLLLAGNFDVLPVIGCTYKIMCATAHDPSLQGVTTIDDAFASCASLSISIISSLWRWVLTSAPAALIWTELASLAGCQDAYLRNTCVKQGAPWSAGEVSMRLGKG